MNCVWLPPAYWMSSEAPGSSFLTVTRLPCEFEVTGVTSFHNFLAVVKVRTTTGITVLHIPTPPALYWPSLNASEIAIIRCTIPECRLYPGTYIISIWIGRNAHQGVDWAPDVLTFSVDQGELASYGFDMSWKHGLYFCDSEWAIEPASRDAEFVSVRQANRI